MITPDINLPPALLHVVVVSPDQLILETDASKVVVPGVVQELAILPNHTPLYSELVKGTIRIDTEDNKTKEIDIDGGIIRVRQNKVSLILGFDSDIEKPTLKSD